uniref:ARID domain-containing protein n=1 Tax=Oryza nivara TaxID=4536 RepID=A0A0E0HAV6_ORYNI
MDQIEDADVEMPELVELVDDEGGLQEIIDIVRVHRWKATYERIIATAADVNSLILSNHVQLLYQFDKNLDSCPLFKAAYCLGGLAKSWPSHMLSRSG